VRAREGDMGIIPGSMGARSNIVRGKGNPESFCSCSHGAGRAMSRNDAKRRFTVEDHVRSQREPLPWEAGFLAGKSFLLYRSRGGLRNSPLPDFYIGAHAAIGRLALLTRDAARYRTYFPKIEILAPTERWM
jgi:predicted nucleic acid-binding protein